MSLFNVTIQLSTPRWVVGRALAVYQTCTNGGMALGSWLWGMLAEGRSTTHALGIASACMLAGALIGLRYPTPKVQASNLDPFDRWKPPEPAFEILPRSGPIFVIIEYIIREQDEPAFLKAMADRERVRRRDGAKQWQLMRDLEKPDLWRETFLSPTWTEYVRHYQRMTEADAALGERIRALHVGPVPPRVHRMIIRPTQRSPSQNGHEHRRA